MLPELGMLGASLLHRGEEHLDLHGGPEAVRGGHTTGLPLLAPWANRLGATTYRAAGRSVDLSSVAGLHRDGNGLPIHGTFVGRAGWVVGAVRTRPGSSTLVVRFDAGADPEVMASFPFPHELTMQFVVHPGEVAVRVTIAPTGRSAVPVSFGWHPYFRLPGVGRDALAVELPARHHLVLDDRQLPTGEEVDEAGETISLRDRTFDDGYRLGRSRRLALVGGGHRLELALDRGYPFAQVYAPEGQAFVALEPMTAATNALGDGTAPVVEPGDRYSARYTISFPQEPR